MLSDLFSQSFAVKLWGATTFPESHLVYLTAFWSSALSRDFWVGWTHVIGKELNSHFWTQELILMSYENKSSVQLLKKQN